MLEVWPKGQQFQGLTAFRLPIWVGPAGSLAKSSTISTTCSFDILFYSVRQPAGLHARSVPGFHSLSPSYLIDVRPCKNRTAIACACQATMCVCVKHISATLCGT